MVDVEFIPPMFPEVWGYLPSFLSVESEESVASQFDEGYKFAGGWSPWKDFKLLGIEPDVFDPIVLMDKYGEEYQFIDAMVFKGETIMLFTSQMVAIVQLDGSFEVCRMD